MCQTLKKIDQLYSDLQRRLDRLVKSHRMTDEDSEDILQDVFVKVLKNKDKLDTIDNHAAWITTIAKRDCVTKLRSRSQKAKLSNQVKEHHHLISETNSNDNVRKLMADITENHLHKYLQKSKRVTESLVAKKFYIDRQNYREISQSLEMNTNTVLSQLSRFRKRYLDHCRREDLHAKAEQKARMMIRCY